MIQNRKHVKKKSIDEYVLESADEFKSIYGKYVEFLKNSENIKFLKYEDMITEFEPWLKELYDFLNIDIRNNQSFDQSVKKASFKVAKEDKNSHIRNIKSGDHLNKLKPSTIEKLNTIFKEELRILNYSN